MVNGASEVELSLLLMSVNPNIEAKSMSGFQITLWEEEEKE